MAKQPTTQQQSKVKPTNTTEFLATVAHLPQDQQIEEYHKFMLEQQISQQKQQQASIAKPDKLALYGTRPTTEFKVGDKEFTIVHWSPTKVHKNIPRIGRYFITPLSMLMGGIKDPESGDVSIVDAIPTALSYLFTILEEDDIMNLYELVLETVYYEDKPILPQFDSAFEDDPFGVFDLVAEVLRINVVAPFIKREGLSSLKNLTSNLMPLVEVAKLK